jgi:hypothetical protein
MRLARSGRTPESTFDLRDIMDKGHVLLVNLAKGKIGEGPAALLGTLMMSSLSLLGLSCSDAAGGPRAGADRRPKCWSACLLARSWPVLRRWSPPR